ncbi:MAG: histidine phosphatase family protein [Noviherbaspirillum sp.]
MRLYLLRHGQPEIAPGICYGSTDLAVAPQEHVRIVAAVAPLLPQRAPVFSSPSRRCRELATRLADALGSGTVTCDERLAEMHFGEWEMCMWDDIPREQVDAWANDPVRYRPGNGESVLQMAQRVHAFHEELRQQQCAHAVVVCHAGTMRVLSECRVGASPLFMASSAAKARRNIAYGELITLDS